MLKNKSENEQVEHKFCLKIFKSHNFIGKLPK